MKLVCLCRDKSQQEQKKKQTKTADWFIFHFKFIILFSGYLDCLVDTLSGQFEITNTLVQYTK